MDTKYQYIDLQDYGFNALALQAEEIPPNEVFAKLQSSLSKIPEIQDLSSYKAIIAESNGIDSAGAVEQINTEAMKQGICLVYL